LQHIISQQRKLVFTQYSWVMLLVDIFKWHSALIKENFISY